MHVRSLYVHPVKSCAGFEVDAVEIGPRGPAGDRRWMLVDDRGRFLTAREHPRLVTVRPTPTPRGLRIEAPGRAPLEVTTPGADAPARPVTVWKDATTAADAGDGAAAWFSAFLGRPCRLVHQRESDRRDISGRPGAAPGDEASFADGYPLLLVGSASLAALNERLASPVGMERFRPNVVIATEEPFAEDAWSRLRIGDLSFAGARRCARCVLTTVDPSTGEPDPDGQPLRMLRAFRFDRRARGVLFGMNLIPRARGTIRVGDLLEPRAKH